MNDFFLECHEFLRIMFKYRINYYQSNIKIKVSNLLIYATMKQKTNINWFNIYIV